MKGKFIFLDESLKFDKKLPKILRRLPIEYTSNVLIKDSVQERYEERKYNTAFYVKWVSGTGDRSCKDESYLVVPQKNKVHDSISTYSLSRSWQKVIKQSSFDLEMLKEEIVIRLKEYGKKYEFIFGFDENLFNHVNY